jgi:serine phosphatase RsbU (regulator of sigma subunit)
VRLEPGDLLLAFTDGMVEARRGDEEFGDERLSAALAARARRPLEEIAAALVSEVSAFAAAEELDDRAVLLARVREAGA